MERIVIEVNKATAKKWRAAATPKKKKIATLLAKALNEQDQPLPAQRNRFVNVEAALSETSLAKEWLCPEDSRWDELLK